MPRGPNGERRPADVVGCAVRVAKTATGEVKEDLGKMPVAGGRAARLALPRVPRR